MSPSEPTLTTRIREMMAGIERWILRVGRMGWRWLGVHTFQPAWLPSQWRHPITGYLIGCALMLVAVGISLFMILNFNRYVFAGPLEFLVVVFLAFTFGAGPSLFATFVGTALFWYIVLTPSWSWSLEGLADVTGLVLYTGVGVSVAILASRVEQARQQATKERTIARQLSARLQTTLDVLPVAVGIVEAADGLTLANRAFHALWGEPLPSAASDEAGRAYRGWRLDGTPIAPDEWGLRQAMRDGVSVLNEEIEIAASAGERRSVLYSAAPIHNAQGVVDGGVVVLLDISERRKLERRTHAALTTLLAMAEALVTPPPPPGAAPTTPAEFGEHMRERPAMQQVLTLTQHLFGGQYASVSVVAQGGEAIEPIAVIGLAPAEAQHWWKMTRQTHLDTLAPSLDTARLSAEERTVVHVERQPLSIPGQEITVPREALVAALRLGAGRICLVTMEVANPEELTAQDFELAMAATRLMGSLVERERVLREREEARAMILALEESNRRMDTFLGIASHELRTPLTSAKLSAQLADKWLRRWLATPGESATDAITAEQVAALQTLITQINDQMARQERLVSDLLDVSRLQTGALELRIAPCDMVAVVQKAVEEQRLLHPERVITLDVTPGDEDVMVQGDADRIGQAVTNYLSNALKYSPEREAVRVSLDADERIAQVRVRDQGPGISTEEQERLWERFYRAPDVSVRSGSGVGLGLGLYITRSIIERLGGQVGVTSAPGTGATFWFTLPRIRP